ncbi:hypothetical protein C4D60_Mb10t23710 [Musa balbisiana]|uniref:Uncharacterized protein n=1 Tax=Musa balbisiana TaxID=52838 RepID=A0A4S8IZ77_MUSBA|nr:hypothetical protein C4D60_Mb10t23710 [Musa balbisiana]
MLYNSSSVSQQMLRRKLEERQQAAEALQRAIELQGRRFMGLQFLDLNSRSLSSSAPACINSPSITTVTQSSSNVDSSCNDGSNSSSSQEDSPTKGDLAHRAMLLVSTSASESLHRKRR